MLFFVMKYSTVLYLLYGCCSLTSAMNATDYKIISATRRNADLLACGFSTKDVPSCATRFRNSTCEPMDKDWCDSKTFEPDSAYLIKRTVTEKLQDTLVHSYQRTLPMFLREGSEIEIRFMLHPNCTTFQINLEANTSYLVLHLQLTHHDEFFIASKLPDGFLPSKKFTSAFRTGYQSRLTIYTDENDFQIDLNGVTRTYHPPIPASTIRNIVAKFHGAPGDLLQIDLNGVTRTYHPPIPASTIRNIVAKFHGAPGDLLQVTYKARV